MYASRAGLVVNDLGFELLLFSVGVYPYNEIYYA